MDDDDDEDMVPQPKSIQVQMAWHAPVALPDREDVTKAMLSSSEVASLNERMAAVLKAFYKTEYDVPNSPAPLSDVEQALDMTSQASSVVQPIPFFVPQVTLPAPAAAATYPPGPSATLPQTTVPPYAPSTSLLQIGGHTSGATPEFVQSLGLPMFLVGQDVQALQTLASSPSLLSTLVDQNGMYDQARLMTLVQTLSGSAPSPAPASINAYSQAQSQGMYGAASMASTPTYGQLTSASFPHRNGFRSNNPDGNLHISGYGPTTTEQDIINLFAPYVIVDEVVMKGNFAFVNTNDPENAQKAREALTGSYLGGMSVRINPAQRKPREVTVAPTGFGGPTANPNFGGMTSTSFSSTPSSSFVGAAVQPQVSYPTPPVVGMAQNAISGFPAPGPPTGIPSGSIPLSHGAVPLPPGIPNVDAVRDDRGNPATKNLFVAGYGHGTTEQQIRDIFSKHVFVVGVVLKGSFTFVNTADRTAAVVAREALSGVQLNGGALRINFAKETGRLGTSFDLTYGPNTGPNARRPPPGPPAGSYYGR
jgi:RNA recognition motif-containing protein